MMDVQPPLRPRPPTADLSRFDTAQSAESSKKVPIAPQPSKRKRDVRASADTSRAASPAQETPAPKKKKANRACFHCQKAHLTCDDARPCMRCVKRGIGDNCTEGHRKKAKYLLDDDELEELKRTKERSNTDCQQTPSLPQTQVITGLSSTDEASSLLPGFSTPTDPLFNITFDPTYTFGSEAANLEYSILSAILNQPGGSPNSNPSLDPAALTNPSPTVANGTNGSPASLHPSEPWGGMPQTLGMHYAQAQAQLPQSGNGNNGPSAGSDSRSFVRTTESHPLPYNNSNGIQRQGSQLALPSPPASEPSTTGEIVKPRATSQVGTGSTNWAYSDGVKKYDYTEGYHFLMSYLHDRHFDKNDILRVVRALAIVRPSLIALQMPLADEDEVFVERCLQRSLAVGTFLELDKLISFSGTPTVVWRRTGEICLVGLEFTMLTEWSRKELLGKRTFIYELFENQSTVEYWEQFAAHAFENSTRSVNLHCVLLKPNGAPVPCAFCFSIRRDLFDLPSLIIGKEIL
ncbi:Transcription activator of gluconeogenesis [Rhizoctonia solani]|uniref:Transcription activator of gluconeogenesis ERT1 n=1 Tax=Rhizoctonia solani TaxID=456999 RepID=A0A8H7LH29_9AGAM|nr:Transcription activator of gluconeogenesis [Rhizoctonia solani]